MFLFQIENLLKRARRRFRLKIYFKIFPREKRITCDKIKLYLGRLNYIWLDILVCWFVISAQIWSYIFIYCTTTYRLWFDLWYLRSDYIRYWIFLQSPDLFTHDYIYTRKRLKIHYMISCPDISRTKVYLIEYCSGLAMFNYIKSSMILV